MILDRRPIGLVYCTPNPEHPRNLCREWASDDDGAAVAWLDAEFRAIAPYYGTLVFCTPAGAVPNLSFTGVSMGDPMLARRWVRLEAMYRHLQSDFPSRRWGWHDGWQTGPDPYKVETTAAETRKAPSLTRNDTAEFHRVNHEPWYRLGCTLWSADASSANPGTLVDYAMNAATHGHEVMGEAVPAYATASGYAPNLLYVRQCQWWALASFFQASTEESPDWWTRNKHAEWAASLPESVDHAGWHGADPYRQWQIPADAPGVFKVYQGQFRGPAECTADNVARDREQGLIPSGGAGLTKEQHSLLAASAANDPAGVPDAT